jgi:hypothetical protein
VKSEKAKSPSSEHVADKERVKKYRREFIWRSPSLSALAVADKP